MGLGNPADFDPWDKPTENDFENVDEDLLRNLVMSQFDLRPVKATTQFAQIQLVVRWYLAFTIDGWVSRRRRFAQHRVAEKNDISLEAVQGRVRDLYDGKYGRKSAQELFEDDLEAIEQAYENHMNAR